MQVLLTYMWTYDIRYTLNQSICVSLLAKVFPESWFVAGKNKAFHGDQVVPKTAKCNWTADFGTVFFFRFQESGKSSGVGVPHRMS